MPSLTIAPADYHQQVLGALTGKSIGVTLAAPVTGSTLPRFVRFYSPVPTQPVASPVLGLPLVTLRAVVKAGPSVRRDDLGVAYLEHFFLPREEFAFTSLNLRRGLAPPISGAYGNWYGSSTGALMRCELWALLLPGAPQQAAACAYRDASIDHRDEGIWAAMFFAGLASAAFFITDVRSLLTIGLAMIPRTCRTARAVKAALVAAYNAEPHGAARDRILKEVGSSNYTDAPQNVGFLALALLYGGRDFGAGICAAVNCGYDAASVAGLTGTVYGIWLSQQGIPDSWKAPIGDMFIPGPCLKDLDVPNSLSDIANSITSLGPDFLKQFDAATAISESEAQNQFPRAAFMEIADVQPPVSPAVPSAEATPSTAPDITLATDEPAPVKVDTATEESAGSTVEASTNKTALLPEDTSTPRAGSAQLMDGAATIEAVAPPADITTDSAQPIDAAATIEAVAPPTDITTDSALPIDAAATIEANRETQPAISQSTTQSREPVPVAEAPTVLDPVMSAIKWADNSLVKPLLVESPTCSTVYAGGFAVRLDTGDALAVVPGGSVTCTCTIASNWNKEIRGAIRVNAPTGWKVEFQEYEGGRFALAAFTGMVTLKFTLSAADTAGAVNPANAVTVTVAPDDAAPVDFAFFLPGATCWWVAGLFANMEGTGFDHVYAPEQRFSLQDTYQDRAYRTVGWQKLASPGPMPNIEPIFGGQSGVLYGQIKLHCPAAAPARFSACCSGGVKVWLNGITILRRNDSKPFRPTPCGGPWSVDVDVPLGTCTVQFKWVRSNIPYEFSFTVADRAGTLLSEVSSCSW